MDAFPDVGRFAVDSMQCQYRRDYNIKKMYVIIIIHLMSAPGGNS
jgi:hypothetical protein